MRLCQGKEIPPKVEFALIEKFQKSDIFCYSYAQLLGVGTSRAYFEHSMSQIYITDPFPKVRKYHLNASFGEIDFIVSMQY